MPEHRARLHRRRPAVPETAPGGEYERHREPDEGAEDVQGMSPDQRVEGGTVRAGRDRQPVADQARPLIARDQEEERAEASREDEPLHQDDLFAARERPEGAHHRDARGEQHERVDAGDAHGEPRLERRRPERLAEPKHEQPRDERGEEHGLAADQEEDGEPQVVERRTPRRGLALRTVATARGRGWWQHGPVRPVRDRTALGRRLEQARRHQRTPTRNEATTRAPMIASRTHSVWRFFTSAVIPCRTPGGPGGPADRGVTRTARGAPRPSKVPAPAGRPARRTPRPGGTHRRRDR